MVCIYCGGKTQVINSRQQKRLNQVWRRRKCLNCAAIFSSHETASYEDGWRVKTAQGSLNPFIRNKLFLSLYTSCQHRKQSIQDATGLTNTIISLLGQQTTDGLLDTAQIIAVAGQVLGNFDKAAAVHYQAFHQN